MSAMKNLHVVITEMAASTARTDSVNGTPPSWLPLSKLHGTTDTYGVDWSSDFAGECVDLYIDTYNAIRRRLDPRLYV